MKTNFTQFIIMAVCSLALFAKQTGKTSTVYEIPSFESEKAFLFDSEEIRGANVSMITLINYTDYRNITFDVFVYSATNAQWENLDKVNLRAFADRASTGQKYKGLKKARYFAIVPAEKDAENIYVYQIVKKQKKGAGTLTIEIRQNSDKLYEEPKPVLNEDFAYIMGMSEIPDDADEDIYINNATSFATISIRIYGYHKKDLKWIPLGTVASTKRKRAIDMEDYDINDFYYFGFVPNSKRPFAYSFRNEHDSLVVIVSDMIE